MKKTILALAILIGTGLSSGKADTFGTGSNQFTIDFTTIGNPGNSADPGNYYGNVDYIYRIGTYEISWNQIHAAMSSGLENVPSTYSSSSDMWLSPPSPTSKPGILSWYESAAFVNWLNTSKGYAAAYKLTWNGPISWTYDPFGTGWSRNNGGWSMSVWSDSDNGYDANNLFRNSLAKYYLPSVDEWYKAAYGKNTGRGYYDYATGSDSLPTAVLSGTNQGTAVFYGNNISPEDYASVYQAGGRSSYGTIGQLGNAYEMLETVAGTRGYDVDGNYHTQTNIDPNSNRLLVGGNYGTPDYLLNWSDGGSISVVEDPMNPGYAGFRVASVADFGAIPEPSTYALFALGGGLLFVAMRRRSPSRS